MESFPFTETVKKLDSKVKLPQFVSRGLERYVSLSHGAELHCSIEWLVLLGNSVYNYFKCKNHYSVRFKLSLSEVKDPLLAELFVNSI